MNKNHEHLLTTAMALIVAVMVAVTIGLPLYHFVGQIATMVNGAGR